MNNNIRWLRDKIKMLDMQGIIISNPINIKYLTGIEADGVFLITPKENIYITDGRYVEAVNNTLTLNDEIVVYDMQDISRDDYENFFLFCENVGFEEEYVTYAKYKDFMHRYKINNLEETEGIIEKQRMIKDPEEIELIEKACKITDDCFNHLKNFIKIGLTEKQIAKEIDDFFIDNGAEDVAFSTIVASGKNSSMPHAVPTNKKIEAGDPITIDMGCKYKGYCSDMTRTIFAGYVPEEVKPVYELVLKNQRQVINEMKEGVNLKLVSRMVENDFKLHGYDLIHALGHGVGLQIISEFQKNYNEATSNMEQEFYIPTSLTGCVTILNSKFIDNPNCEILGRDAECEEIWRNMMKKTKRNVILVGKPGVGKSSIVYKLTSDIVNQRCPEMFNDFIVLSLDVNNIISGTTLRGQAEERFQDLIELMKKHNNVILFIDEIHMIVGAGAVSHGEKQDLSNALKPILAGDDAIVIGATTDEEYAQTFGMEGALRRRFKTITVREPRTTEVYDMLKESIRQLEEFHGVRISKKMVEMIIFYSSCFNYNTSNPDRTKDLIDVSMVTARMSGKDRVDRESIMKNFGANFEEFRNMSEEMVRSTAYHEVGHFIVQRFSDKLIDRKAIAISIVPAEGYLGLTVTDATDKTVNKDKSYFTDLIADLLAGRIAEKLFMKSENNAGAESDLEKATKIAFKMVTKYGMASRLGENQIYLNDKDYQMQTPAVTEIVNREVQKILEEAAKKATLVLDEHQEVVEELVNELTKKGMLSGKELNSIIELYEQKQAVTV